MEEEENSHPLSWSVSLGDLMRRGSSDDEGEEDETEALLSRVRADNQRLRELVDEEVEDGYVVPCEGPETESAPSVSDLLGMSDPTPAESLEGGIPPTIDELLQMCEDDDACVSKLTGFICPDCLMVAPSQASLKEHYNKTHSLSLDSTGLAHMLARASSSTKRRLVRRLKRLTPQTTAHPERSTWLAAGGAVGLAVALVGAPVTGLAVAAAAGAAHASRLRRERRDLADRDDDPQKQLSASTSLHETNAKAQSLREKEDTAVLVIKRAEENAASDEDGDEDEVIVRNKNAFVSDTVVLIDEAPT